jgi:hypothetical protein
MQVSNWWQEGPILLLLILAVSVPHTLRQLS